MPLPTVSGIWRVGTDPELKFSPSGVAVCTFRAAASSVKKREDGGWDTTGEIWVTVTTFYELAEHCVNSVVKGAQVAILGKIQVDEWTTDSGDKRQTVKVLADAVSPLHEHDKAASKPASSNSGGDPWAGPSSQTDEPPFLVMPDRFPFH